MSPLSAVRAVVARRKPGPSPADPSSGRREQETCEADVALRLAVRSEVAGATPRSDAWQQLQKRILREAELPAVVPGYGRPTVIISPFSPNGPFTLSVLSRFSQLSMAVLLLLAVLGNPATLEHFTQSAGRLAHVVPVAQMTNPLPLPVRVNRAAQDEATADAQNSIQATQAAIEPDPQPTIVYMTGPAVAVILHPRQAVDPDLPPSSVLTPKVDPR